MATRKKKEQVAKVSKETKVSPEDLARLPQDALQKLDDLVADEDDLLGGTTVVGEVLTDTIIVSSLETPLPASEVETQEGSVLSGKDSGAVVDETVVGINPVTGEVVRVCDQ